MNMQTSERVLSGELRTAPSEEAPGGRCFAVIGTALMIIFDLPPNTEELQPALVEAIESKESVVLTWSRPGTIYDDEAQAHLPIFENAVLHITNKCGTTEIPVIAATPKERAAA